MAFATKEIIAFSNKVTPTYNISQPVQDLVLKALDELGQVNDMIRLLVESRNHLAQALGKTSQVTHIYPSDANFLLVRFKNAKAMYTFLLGKGIVLRDRSNVLLCDQCLRITVGTDAENEKLLEAINEFS